MVAIDTHVVVRLLVGDDVRQAAAAARLFASSPILITRTVLLESEWVLRGLYRFDRPRIAAAFERLLGLPQVEVDDIDAVERALTAFGRGMDFADALHVAQAAGRAEESATFDRTVKAVAGVRIRRL